MGFEKNAPKAVIGDLMDFFADRLKVALKEQGVRHDLISAVFALGNEDDLDASPGAGRCAARPLSTARMARTCSPAISAPPIFSRIEEKKDGVKHADATPDAVLAEAG